MITRNKISRKISSLFHEIYIEGQLRSLRSLQNKLMAILRYGVIIINNELDWMHLCILTYLNEFVVDFIISYLKR